MINQVLLGKPAAVTREARCIHVLRFESWEDCNAAAVVACPEMSIIIVRLLKVAVDGYEKLIIDPAMD